MRDWLIVLIVALGATAALRFPWIGVLVWTWLSTMNPHRFAFGPAYDAPLAAVAAGATLLGLVFSRDKSNPFKGAAAIWLLLFALWITVSWHFGLDPDYDLEQWKKVMKVLLMIFVALAVMHSKRHVVALVWVAAGSLALLGIKGGYFTLLHGGNYRVWGPPGSFIADNNEFALALIVAIPLLRFLQLQLAPGWRRHAMTVTMVLCAAAALGTHSRGALIAIVAMSVMLWWRGRSRLIGGVVMVAVAVGLLAFMPDAWVSRMSSISSYDQDDSSLGRISAWWNAWGIAKDYLTGVGFHAARPELFARYSPYPERVHAAHSIYFQILGNHGFVGLFLFVATFVSAFWTAGRLMKVAAKQPKALWCVELGALAQVALVGYAVGGAFLSLSYFDLPYNIVVMVVLAMRWVTTEGWERETSLSSAWLQRLRRWTVGPTTT